MAGTWKALAHQPPFRPDTMLLLTDGTVMCQEYAGIGWWKLTPDPTGDYVNGTWSRLAPMHDARLFYASAVLADGRVFVAGGEYSSAGGDTPNAEIYHPLHDGWLQIASPAGWTEVGDAPCCVLADGRVLLGSIQNRQTAILDPVGLSWTAAALKDDSSSEESWVLLAGGSVLTAECTNHPNAEKYLPDSDAWVGAGVLPVDLVEASSLEIGPGVLLPDGRALFLGATPHTALYTPPAPPAPSDPGSWAAGPDFPPGDKGETLGAKDAPACLLPNGRVLCAAGPVDGIAADYLSPTYFFEHDGSAFAKAPPPGNVVGAPFQGRMMLLPTGQVLFSGGTPEIYVYDPDGQPDKAWAPTITVVPPVISPQGTYRLIGTQLNGRSQAVAYGDDVSSATNYPLVRLSFKASGKVRYCRTFNHTVKDKDGNEIASMGVATGATPVSTWFTVPADIETGAADLVVVANGIPSEPRAVTVQA